MSFISLQRTESVYGPRFIRKHINLRIFELLMATAFSSAGPIYSIILFCSDAEVITAGGINFDFLADSNPVEKYNILTGDTIIQILSQNT